MRYWPRRLIRSRRWVVGGIAQSADLQIRLIARGWWQALNRRYLALPAAREECKALGPGVQAAGGGQQQSESRSIHHAGLDRLAGTGGLAAGPQTGQPGGCLEGRTGGGLRRRTGIRAGERGTDRGGCPG